MYLIDTNIWLELLLRQDKASEVAAFFQAVDASSLAITDFTLYSIGIILTRFSKRRLIPAQRTGLWSAPWKGATRHRWFVTPQNSYTKTFYIATSC